MERCFAVFGRTWDSTVDRAIGHSGLAGTMRGGRSISIALMDTPFAAPVPHLAVEPAVSQGRDDESALAEGGIGLGVAVAAQGDQPVEVEVRASLGALGHMMHIQAGPDAARLTGPPGAGQDLGANLLPLLETGGGSAEGQRPAGADPATGGPPHADPIREPSGTGHALRRDFAHVGKRRCLSVSSLPATAWPPGAPTQGGTRGTPLRRWQRDWAS